MTGNEAANIPTLDKRRLKVSYYKISAFVGFLIGLAMFFVAFLAVEARASARRILTLTACAAAFLVGMAWLFVLDFPRGLLQEAVRLPWPIG